MVDERARGLPPGKSPELLKQGSSRSCARTDFFFVPPPSQSRGLTCGYFRDLWPSLWTEKSKLYAGIFVSQGPSGTYGVGWMRGAAGYPMGCQIGRLTRHETPLARPSQATKISKPNRFAYPFRSRPRGVSRPLWLNLPEHQTPSYRDTANLGFGVTPRARAFRSRTTPPSSR